MRLLESAVFQFDLILQSRTNLWRQADDDTRYVHVQPFEFPDRRIFHLSLVPVRHLGEQTSMWNDRRMRTARQWCIRTVRSLQESEMGYSRRNSDQSRQASGLSLYALDFIAVIGLSCQPSFVDTSPLAKV
jgi:hypothetical protein